MKVKEKYDEMWRWLDANIKWRVSVWEGRGSGSWRLVMQVFTSDTTSAYFIAELLRRIFPEEEKVVCGDEEKKWDFHVEVEPVDIDFDVIGR